MTTDEKLSPEQLAKRNSFRRLVKDLNAVSSRNLGKSLFAFFFMAICQAFLISFLMMPLYSRTLKGIVDGTTFVLFGLLMFASFLVWALFQYGFFSLLLRLVRGEYVTIGFIFLGFKKVRHALPVASFVAFVLSVLASLTATGIIVLTDIPSMLVSFMTAKNDAAAVSALHFDVRSAAVIGVSVLCLVWLFFTFAFIFLSAYDAAGAAFSSALKANLRLLHKKRWLLFRLLLVAGGRFLLIALAAVGLHTVLVFYTAENTMTFGKLALNFIYLVNFYTALLRIYFALPVLYETVRRPRTEIFIEDRSDSAVIDETIALLEHENREEAGASTSNASAPSDSVPADSAPGASAPDNASGSSGE
ncbi:MAG: hypothetical protein K6G80_11075 [Treponema sp.]|nr:hypothetical protein [Treponema sp.]